MQDRISSKGLTWVDVSEPTNDELAAFVRDTSLLPHDAEFVVQNHHRPEVTVRKDYILILTHIPIFDKRLRVTSGVPLYFVISKDTVWTLHYSPIVMLNKIAKDFTDNPEKQEEYFDDSALSLGLHIISQLNSSSLRKISRLEKHIEIAEDAVFHGNERKMVEEIAILTRDVLDFRKIIRPQIALFSTVPEGFSGSTADQWERAGNHMNQMWEVLESLFDSSKELRNTNDSLLQYKENGLLRLLSWYSIIAIPVWIFVSPYNPRSIEATVADIIVFWSVLILLIVVLLWIVLRARRRGVL